MSGLDSSFTPAGGVCFVTVHAPAGPCIREPPRMAIYSSSSTLAQLQAAWEDNASYAEDNSPSKCRQFITLSTILLGKVPAVSALGSGGVGERVEYNQEMRLRLLDDAKRWLSVNANRPDRDVGVTHADVRNFRG